MANLPTYLGKGTFVSGTTSITPGVPAGITNEDFLLMLVHTPNQAVTTPAGWTQAPSSPVSTGTANTALGVRLTVFYKPVAGIEAATAVAVTGGTASAGIIFAFRGVNLANPFMVTPTTRVDATGTTAMSWQTLTTTAANALIVMATANDHDLAGTAGVGVVTAAGLTGITEAHDQTVATGTGGGVHMAYGNRVAAGAIGTMTATGAAAVAHAYMTIALQAAEPVVRTVGQYRNDFVTPIDTGASTVGDGISNSVYLQAEYDSGIRTMATTPKVEVDPVGTAFTGTPSATHKNLTQADNTNFFRSLRGSTMIYDDVNKRLVLFGGTDGTTRYNTVWHRYIDRPGQPWRLLTVTGTPPAGRNLHSFTFVKGNLTSGGATRAYGIVWGGALPADDASMFALRLDIPGSEAWTTITQTTPPTARSYLNGHTVATPGTDSSNQYLYLFGGWAAVRENAIYRCTFDVDTPTAVTWTVIKAQGAAGSPSGRTGVVVGYKASTNKIYQFGGYDGTTYHTEFWEYDIAGNTWTNTAPTGTAPVATECGSGGYDAINNRFWYTGGWTTNGTFTTGTNHIVYINDVGGAESYVNVRANTPHPGGDQTYAGHSFAGFCVVPDKGWLCIKNMITRDPVAGGDHERYGYIIDFNENVTSEFPVYGENEGEYYMARDAMGSVWNPKFHEWVQIGGFDDMYDDATIASGTHSGDVWVYNEADNTWRYACSGFKILPPLEGRVACYDTIGDRIIVFGGLSGVEMTSQEVWQLVRDIHGNYVASPLRPTGTKPSTRWLGACAYDPINNRVIITMGGTQAGPTALDVWELSFTSSAQGIWTQRTPTGTVTAVKGPGFAQKTSNSRLYIFGGATNSALTTVVGNFVYLDYSTTNCAWNTITQTGQVARRTPAMDIDNTWDRILVFGGFNGTAVVNTMSWYNLASGTTWATAAPTGPVPDARRSAIGQVINGKFYVTGGRPNTGTWYRNTWELQPDYTTPNSSVWVNKFPASFTPVYHQMTGGTNNTSYHWQAWTTEGSVDSPKVSYPTAVFIHTFDGSGGAVLDPQNVWTDDMFATDGRFNAVATNTALGSVSTNFLHIQGTTAHWAGYPITQVRARINAFQTPTNSFVSNAAIYTDGLAELLGTTTNSSTTTLGPWTTLTAPTGGWTWPKLQALETKIYTTNTFNVAQVSNVEIEITTGNAETVADFVLGTPTPSFEKFHYTDSLKKIQGTKSHTTDSDHRSNIHFTKATNPTLPTTADPLGTAFSKAEVANAITDNTVYADVTGDVFLLYVFERWHTNSTDQINATWNGKSTIAPSTRPVYLQIWNKTTLGWETLASNNAAAANTDFTLTGGKTTGLSDYYQTGNKVVFRVYQ